MVVSKRKLFFIIRHSMIFLIVMSQQWNKCYFTGWNKRYFTGWNTRFSFTWNSQYFGASNPNNLSKKLTICIHNTSLLNTGVLKSNYTCVRFKWTCKLICLSRYVPFDQAMKNVLFHSMASCEFLWLRGLKSYKININTGNQTYNKNHSSSNNN